MQEKNYPEIIKKYNELSFFARRDVVISFYYNSAVYSNNFNESYNLIKERSTSKLFYLGLLCLLGYGIYRYKEKFYDSPDTNGFNIIY